MTLVLSEVSPTTTVQRAASFLDNGRPNDARRVWYSGPSRIASCRAMMDARGVVATTFSVDVDDRARVEIEILPCCGRGVNVQAKQRQSRRLDTKRSRSRISDSRKFLGGIIYRAEPSDDARLSPPSSCCKLPADPDGRLGTAGSRPRLKLDHPSSRFKEQSRSTGADLGTFCRSGNATSCWLVFSLPATTILCTTRRSQLHDNV